MLTPAEVLWDHLFWQINFTKRPNVYMFCYHKKLLHLSLYVSLSFFLPPLWNITVLIHGI